MSSNSLFNQLLTQIPVLTTTNWFNWKTEMEMLLAMEGLSGIVLGTDTKDKAQDKAVWEKDDSKARVAIYFRIDSQYRPLFQGHTTSYQLWTALIAKFQASNMATRIDALRHFYTTIHDPSQPVDFYIQALKTSKEHLKAITGEDIKDQHFMDILLMNLHPDFGQIRTSILSQSTEPTLDHTLSILTKSQDIPSPSSMMIKQESVLAAYSRPPFGSGGSQVDDKGFKWCDVSGRDGVCHRCGRPGHIAAFCIINMPEKVKNWVMHKPQSGHLASEVEPQIANSAYGYGFSSSSDGPFLI